MTKPMWIVCAPSRLVTNHQPEELARLTGLPFEYADAGIDALEWGPHHPDLKTQSLLRAAYHGWDWNDIAQAKTLRDTTLRGEELLLWCPPEVPAFLNRIWLLDWLISLDADLSRVRLALDPLWHWQTTTRTPEEVVAMVEGAIPVAEFAESLAVIRRYLASDSETIEVDTSELPPAVAEWAGLGNRMSLLFPDRRGLDWFDSLILEQLTDEWQRTGWIVGNSILGCQHDFSIGSDWLWHKLIEMSDKCDLITHWSDRRPLCEIRFGKIKSPLMLAGQVRITQRGKGVRSGRSDALRHRSFFRWVGGRLLTNELMIRFEGSYRERTPLLLADPESRPE